MFAEDYINKSNEIYSSRHADFKYGPSELDHMLYSHSLEYIPRVHELAHLLSAAFGGPDNNYEFTEHTGIPMEIGMLKLLNLLDRHLDDSFLGPAGRSLNYSGYTDIFYPNVIGVKRYPAARWVNIRSEFEMKVYSCFARELMLKKISEIKPELVIIGENFGKLLVQRKNMQLLVIVNPDPTDLSFYPEYNHKELSNALHHNELELKKILETTTVQELFQMFYEVTDNFPDTVEKLKETQAIFVHVVFGYTPEFCINHFKLKNSYPNEFIIWNKDQNGKICFNAEKAYRTLRKHYPF
jgi:hypothetical protein